jgi:hypothetical protein
MNALTGSYSRGIEKLAWDTSGERLALSFRDGNEMYRGLIAIYDVRRSPLVSLSLVEEQIRFFYSKLVLHCLSVITTKSVEIHN